MKIKVSQITSNRYKDHYKINIKGYNNKNEVVRFKKDFIEFLRKENRFHEAEKGFAKRRDSVLTSEDEKAIEVDKDSSQDSRNENSEKEDGSPDPTEVIDWLLKKYPADR